MFRCSIESMTSRSSASECSFPILITIHESNRIKQDLALNHLQDVPAETNLGSVLIGSESFSCPDFMSNLLAMPVCRLSNRRSLPCSGVGHGLRAQNATSFEISPITCGVDRLVHLEMGQSQLAVMNAKFVVIDEWSCVTDEL